MTIAEPQYPRTAVSDRPTLRDAIALLDEAAAAPKHTPTAASALETLIGALTQQDTALLDEIERTEPRLASRISSLRELTAETANRAGLLRRTVEHPAFDPTTTRHHVVDLARRVRELQSTESDIIFDALNTDLGAGD